MTMELRAQKCEPCEKGAKPLKDAALQEYSAKINKRWNVVENRRLECEFSFNDFKDALAFTNRVGVIAEEQGHHPDIQLSWGMVRLALSTHSIGGLSENDFILASKIDALK